jgi:hypothetical protein
MPLQKAVLIPKIRLDNWDFDVRILGPSGILEIVGLRAFESKGLLHHFGIPPHVLSDYLKELERGYFDSNEYHTAAHAADVCQAIFCLLKASKIQFTELETMAVLFSALVHDLRHPGVNNNFLTATKDPLALRYNNLSILENMHVSEAMQMLLQPHLNFLSHLAPAVFQEFSTICVQLVLSTDMVRHIELMSQFTALVTSGELCPKNKNHRLILLKMLIKFADISNPSRPWPTCKSWSQCVMDEFFAQGDRERALGIPISPMMDRETTSIPKC